MCARLQLSQLTLNVADEERARRWARSETAPPGAASLYAAVDGSPNYALVQCTGAAAAMPKNEVPATGAVSKIARYRGELVNEAGCAENDHTVIQVVAFDVPPEWRAEVDAWYDHEHLDLLMRADGWLRALRMSVEHCVGPRFTSIAVHELKALDVMNSPERAAARSTPWRAQFSSQRWFEDSGRWLYRRLKRRDGSR